MVQGGEKQGKVQKLSKGEVLMLNIGSMCTGARVIAVCHCLILQTADSRCFIAITTASTQADCCMHTFLSNLKKQSKAFC